MTTSERILRLWRAGYDTFDIAERLSLTEAQVYNLRRSGRVAS